MKNKIISAMLIFSLGVSMMSINVQATKIESTRSEQELIKEESTVDYAQAVEVKELNGHYYAIFDVGFTWEEAKKYCEDLGGYLMTITSSEEQSVAVNLLKEGTKNSYWLGGYKDSNGQWEWTTNETFQYTNWAPGQPDNFQNNEDALMIYRNRNPLSGGTILGTWNDLSADGTCNGEVFFGTGNIGFICEWEGSYPGYIYNINQNPTNQKKIAVYVNKNGNDKLNNNYMLSKTAIAECEGTQYPVDENGIALVEESAGDITISQDGYISRTFTREKLEQSLDVYLQKDEDGPVISGVWIGNVDVLNSEYPVDLTSREELNIQAEIDWDDSSEASLELKQSSNSVSLSGESANIVLGDYFDVSDTIYLVAADAKGRTTRKQLKFKCSGKIPDVLDGYEISIGGDGVSVTIEKDNWLLKNLEVGLEVDTGGLPINISVEDSKVYITLGLELDKFSVSNDNMKHKFESKNKTLFENLKSDYSDLKKGIKNLKNIKHKYKDAIRRPQGTFGFKADVTVMGFVEGYINSEGGLEFVDSGIIFAPSVAAEWGSQFVFPPLPMVPLYWEAYVKGEGEARWNLLCNEQLKSFVPNGKIDASLALGGGLGVGMRKFMSAGGGIEGKFNVNWDVKWNSEDYVKLSAQAAAYAKVVLACFELKNEWPTEEWVFYDSAGTTHSSSQLKSLNFIDFYDTKKYTSQDRSYIQSESVFRANMKSETGLYGLTPEDTEAFLNNVYPQSEPQLVNLDSQTKLLVWVDDNRQRSDINRTCLYYSYYDGNSWSEPAAVEDDGTQDASPMLRVIDGNAWLVWRNAAEEFDEAATLDTIAADMGISAAVFHPENNSFAVYNISGESDTLNMEPVICGEGDVVSVIWIRNGENDWFGNHEANSIMASHFNGTEWTAPETMYSGLQGIDSMTASYINSNLSVAWAGETDGDISTINDFEIFVNGVQQTSNERIDSAPQYCNQVLYWYSDGSIYTEEGDIVQSDISGLTDQYQVISENGLTVIFYTREDGITRQIYAVLYDEEKQCWGKPVAVSQELGCADAFAAIAEADGSLTLAVSETEITEKITAENPYGLSRLTLYHIAHENQLVIEDSHFDSETFVAGGSFVFTLDVTNKGTKTADAYTVTLKKLDGTELSSCKYTTPIFPGETKELTVGYIVQDTSAQDIVITVSTESYSDSTTVNISQENAALENFNWGTKEDGSIVIYGDVVNRGYGIQSGITVSLRDGGAEGSVLETKSIKDLESMNLEKVDFCTSFEQNKVYCITLENPGTDMNTGDNYAFVFVVKPYELPFTDVNQSSWYYSTVKEAYELGLMTGTTSITFAPNSPMTRAMATAVLYRISGSPAIEYESIFSDVADGKYYSKCVTWAAKNKIVNGYAADNTFRPNANVTREQMAVILYNYAKFRGLDVSTQADLSSFNDVGQISSYARTAMSWAVGNKLMSGTLEGNLNPKSEATRAECAKMLLQTYKLIEGNQ